MKSRSNTKNQHFVSQCEQRLNTLNPEASREKQKIYSFIVIDREDYSLHLENRAGIKIKNNLAWMDLFSFDVIDSEYRDNLEACFRDYEADVAEQSQALLRKLDSDGKAANILNEVINVFAAKLLNLLRNPYSVSAVLNTFHSTLSFRPVDPQLAHQFDRVVEGNRPQEQTVCERFQLTPQVYRAWLQALFMLLFRAPGATVNVFEALVTTLFENNYVSVMVHRFTDPDNVCLLSDRGFNSREQDQSRMFLDFNLGAQAFIQYAFCDIRGVVSEDTDPEVIAELERRREIKVHYRRDELDALVNYNRLTTYQCHRRVYAARPRVRL